MHEQLICRFCVQYLMRVSKYAKHNKVNKTTISLNPKFAVLTHQCQFGRPKSVHRYRFTWHSQSRRRRRIPHYCHLVHAFSIILSTWPRPIFYFVFAHLQFRMLWIIQQLTSSFLTNSMCQLLMTLKRISENYRASSEQIPVTWSCNKVRRHFQWNLRWNFSRKFREIFPIISTCRLKLPAYATKWNWNKTVLKLFCFGFISSWGQFSSTCNSSPRRCAIAASLASHSLLLVSRVWKRSSGLVHFSESWTSRNCRSVVYRVAEKS